MRVLVTFAVDPEFAPWRKLRTFREVMLSPKHWSGETRVCESAIGQHTVWVYLTGIGIKCFDFKCAGGAKSAGIDVVISSGLAGSLNAKYSILSVIAPRHVASLKNATRLSVSSGMLDLAAQKGAILVDTLLTADGIVDSPAKKKHLSQFADAVDMESLHVVRAFMGEQIPVGIIRAISDANDEELPVDFEQCLTPSGTVKVLALLKQLANQPGKLPALVRFARQSRAAAEGLARFLDEYIQALRPEHLGNEVMEAAGQ